MVHVFWSTPGQLNTRNRKEKNQDKLPLNAKQCSKVMPYLLFYMALNGKTTVLLDLVILVLNLNKPDQGS